MATDQENPLVKALPPESDYLTYLTIIEYNLTVENLPVLHQVLQDEKLAINIGWDLVHLLIPLLPESEQCLDDVARLGNPREVILKVTESLRLIEYDRFGSEDEDETPLGNDDVKAKVDTEPPMPLPVSQFVALLSMLSVLQGRIKTKYPSRFLSTTLQAILASFGNSISNREEMIEAIVKFVKATTGIARPTLPARTSSGMLQPWHKAQKAPATDPEGSQVEVSFEDRAIQTKLLQSFLTHVVEEYLLNFRSYDDVPGMAWCSRIMEKTHPERNLRNDRTFGRRFATEESLQKRIDSVGQLFTLAQDLKLTDEQLSNAAVSVERVADLEQAEDEPPNSADDIPLSRLGSLLLFAAKKVSSVLYDRPSSTMTTFQIFPDHYELLKNCLASHEMGSGQLGTEPEALIDSLLALGIVCLERDDIGSPSTDEQFNEYLQTTALLSSNCPNSNLRGHANYLTSTILRSQPDEEVRLAFIRDTLEDCPFENLKVSAVGWIKGETIEANPPPPAMWLQDEETAAAGSPSSMASHEHSLNKDTPSSTSIFAKPFALDRLAPSLFPSLHTELLTPPIHDAWMTFQTNLSFYLASLNFLYLLLLARHLHNTLDIHDLWTNHDIHTSFLQPLRDARVRFLGEMKEADGGGALAEERTDSVLAELNLLEETIERVEKAVPLLNESQELPERAPE